MAGHSHWSSIKHKKGAADKKRGKLFSKLSRQITVSAKDGGGDLDANLKLQYAVEAAKAANMTKDTIERAIKKGTGELEGERYEPVMYEGFGHGGVAILMEGLSDNKNRTLNEIRAVFDKNGGNLAGSNAVAWMFDRKAVFTIALDAADEDTMLEAALEAGAENVEAIGGFWEITCPPEDFGSVRDGLKDKYKIASGGFTQIPKNTVKVDEENGRKLLNLIEHLDDHDDINDVYANFDLPEALLAEG